MDSILVWNMISLSVVGALFQASDTSSEAVVSERSLVAHLFDGYEKKARPVHDVRDYVMVNVTLLVVSISELRSKDQVLVTYSWMNSVWKDEFMVWDPAKWGGAEHIVVPVIDIWKPDIVIKNSATSVYGDLQNQEKTFRAKINYNGTVSMWTAGEVQTYCLVDMTHFPFDQQICEIIIESWTYTNNYVKLHNASGVVFESTVYKQNGQWDILGSSSQLVTPPFLGDPNNAFDKIEFDLYIRRKPTYYVLNMVVPFVLLSLLVPVIFAVDSRSGEKVSFGITVMLSFSVFEIIVAGSVPRTSEYVPVMVIYILITKVLAATSIALSVKILSIQFNTPDSSVPGWVVRVVNAMARVVRMTPITADKARPPTEAPHHRLGDSAVQLEALNYIKNNLHGRRRLWKEAEFGKELTVMVCKIREDLGVVRAALDRKIADVTTAEQWLRVAAIVDRVCLIVYTGMLIICNIIMFVVLPKFRPAILVSGTGHPSQLPGQQ